MEQAPSDVSQPPSIYRGFKHYREYPALPEGFHWETQTKHYCPPNLLIKSEPTNRQSNLKHKFGYVFCHRGLYERASRTVDNSARAIDNGVKQGLFLHEVDAFVFEKLDRGFVAHDKNPRRVTSKNQPWQSYSFYELLKTSLVTRHIQTALTGGVEAGTPDFASSYLTTDDKVLGLLDALWRERIGPVGRTLQIDLRDEDFATAIPHYSYHISKRPFQHKHFAGAHKSLTSSVYESIMLKGYNMYFKSFEHLREEIEKKSEAAYRQNYFEIRQLPLFPPLIMVFYSDPLINLAKETARNEWHAKSYEHIYKVTWDQVSSYVRIGGSSYSFILEIVHSGLGLGYNREKNEYINPLTGDPLEDDRVKFDCLVDRAMIDVSLDLRKQYPELLFSSCTRLPDVITSKGKFKAHHATSRLVALPDPDSEKGLSAKLKAMHGGLYPQSHLVVADDPAAEIAARTWIDERTWREGNRTVKLDRQDLLEVPYHKWLARAGPEVVNAMDRINDDFLPNKYGGSVNDDFNITDTPSDMLGRNEEEPRAPVDADEKIISWLKTNIVLSRNPSSLTGTNMQGSSAYSQSDLLQSGVSGDYEADGNDGDVLGQDLHLVASEAWKGFEEVEENQQGVAITVAGKRFIFLSPEEAKRAASSVAAFKAALEGNEPVLEKLIESGADVNISKTFHGTALCAACRNGHDDVVELLLGKGADFNRPSVSGTPLELASQHGHIKIVNMLLEAHKKTRMYTHQPEQVFKTALHLACRDGHEPVVRLLLSHGHGVVNFKGDPYHTALEAACMNGDLKIIEILLEGGAEVNAHSGGVYKSPLGAACIMGHHDAAARLLAKKAKIDFPLSEHFKPDIIELLVKYGANRKEFRKSESYQKSAQPSKWTTSKMRSNRNELRRTVNAPPLKQPPQLRSCGCLICFIDQAIQPSISRRGPPHVSTGDPVLYTLRQSKDSNKSEKSEVPTADKSERDTCKTQ
ncbi:hypothetical protein SCAR479_10152 [Seiridium cardinale]|uniref:Uncharacterized protein n=1 Tax=Seiridium cardinale TaxID=138064 RepID=A0ABR2XHD5_9PEZI